MTENFPIERRITIITKNSFRHFFENIKKQSDLVFYNGNIYPCVEHEIVNICWYKLDSVRSQQSQIAIDHDSVLKMN